MKLRHKNNSTFYNKTFQSTMTLTEGINSIPFYTKAELLASDRNYSDEGSPFKNTKGGEIRSIYLLFIPEAYGALKVPPSKEAVIDGYAKLVNSGVLEIKHDTDLIGETPLSELLSPAPLIFPSELKDVTSTYKDFIPPINVIQPHQQSVQMKNSSQLLITYDKPLIISPNANLETTIKLMGGVTVPAALVGYKLSLRFVSKVFTGEMLSGKPQLPAKKA
ncbi:MAG: hypothetical protein IPL26_00215 [Leptospiraceae bacterium]|nr:hypothetical protein [Leptospiraceae bacterium]